MISEKIFLSEERNAYMTTYLIENSSELHNGLKRPLVVICPGGGYSFHSDTEGEPIALKYISAGFHAIVLRYGIGEYAAMPGPLKDIADTLAYIRKHSDDWFVNPDQIFVSGFSAGAHVAAALGVFWNNQELLPEYKDNQELIKPNGMILGYPVLDLKSTCTHLDIGIQPGVKMDDIGFAQRHPKMPQEKYFIMDEKEGRYFIDFEVAMNAFIFGGEYTDEQEEFYSLQNHVSKTTPPTFIWHSAMDGLIKPSNSLKFASKLCEYEVPYEIHIYGQGNHGMALANKVTATTMWDIEPAATGWIDLAIDWINRSTKTFYLYDKEQ